MILESTIDSLNDIGFGSQANRLELFLRDVSMQYKLKCPIIQHNLYNQLKNYGQQLLGHIIEDNFSSEITSIDRENNVNNVIESINNAEQIQITQIIQISGVTVKLRYINGRLTEAYTEADNQEIDLMEKIQDILPNYINQLKDKEVVISGKIQIPKEFTCELKELGYENINHQIVHFIVQRDYEGIKPFIRFIADDIQTNDQVWDGLNELKSFHFETPQKLRAQRINKLNLKVAEEKIIETFNSLQKNNQIKYIYDTIVFSDDSKDTTKQRSLQWRHKLFEEKPIILETIVQAIEWQQFMGKYKANVQIDPIRTKTGIKDKLKNISLRDIDRFKIIPGHKISIEINYAGNIKLYRGK